MVQTLECGPTVGSPRSSSAPPSLGRGWVVPPPPPILSVLYKSKELVLEKKRFQALLHVIITNKLPVTILQTYMSLPRYVRIIDVLMRRNIASDLCTALDFLQFRKELRKCQERIMFERNSYFHHCLLSCSYVMFQKQYFE